MRIINWIKDNRWLVGILAVGAFLRFYKLDFQSPWLDELHTLLEADPAQTLSGVYASLVAAEPHPPLYFYIIYLLFSVFGHSIIVVRAFSAVVGIAGIFATYLLGKEIADKKTALIAASLLSVNIFHIYYSQDGRPYSLLFFGSALAFYLLIRLIKNPNPRNAILYGAGASLMLYGHFFGLFSLVAQYLILLIVLWVSPAEERKRFFTICVLSAGGTAVLFSPSIGLFLQAANIENIWIPMPGAEAYTEIYKEFFGHSEIVIALAALPVLLYFLRLSQLNHTRNGFESIIANKSLFGAMVLLLWIATVLFIPLVRTYTALPLIVSRYFINILPAVVLIIAIGIRHMKSAAVRNAFLGVFVLFSLNHLFLVKKYYSSVSKSQFREVSEILIKQGAADAPVVSSLSWYYSYFLNNEAVPKSLVQSDLESYVQNIEQDSTLVKPFWYSDGHGRPYSLSPKSQEFLASKFLVLEDVQMYGAWAKYYVPLEKTTDLKQLPFENPNEVNRDKVNYFIESFEDHESTATLSGWIYFLNQTSEHSKISILLVREGEVWEVPSVTVHRDDVTSYFKSQFNLARSGFSAIIQKERLKAGTYTVAIKIGDSQTKMKAVVMSDKKVEVK